MGDILRSVILLSVAAVLAAACGPAAAPGGGAKSGAPLQPATVKVGVQYSLSDGGVFVALDKGFFKEQAIEVELERMDAAQINQALASGQIDAGGTAPVASTINAAASGVKLKIVADKGMLAPKHDYIAFVVRKELADTIKDWKDLKGRTIGIQPPLKATGSSYILAKGLEKGGLTESDVNVESVTFADQTAALGGGKIDVGLHIEPSITGALDRGIIVRWKAPSELVGQYQLGGLAYSEQFINQRKDVAQRFMVAYIKALRAYLDAFDKNKGKAEIAAILAQYTPVKDTALYDRMVVPGFHPDGYFDPKAATETQEYYSKVGTVQKKIDINTILDDQFSKYAVQQLGPYK